MKNFKKHILLLSTAVILMFSSRAEAGNMTMSTYYPSVIGSYNKLRLYPHASDLAGSCPVGSLYVNSANALQFCQNNGGSGTWGPISDSWTQSGDNIYLTNSLTNSNLHVGIGTQTPLYKLTLMNDGGIIAKGTFGSGAVLPDLIGSSGDSRLIWYPRKAAFRAGNVSSSQWYDSNIGNYSVAFGKNTTASGAYSVAAGGDSNTASGQYATVLGGQSNLASGDYSAIAGGKTNTASGQYTAVTGGDTNSASANYTTVLGGQINQATALYSTVSGGVTNTVSTPYSNINGGKNNAVNQISGDATGYSVIGGGSTNKARNNYTVVTGGTNNNALAPYASVGGGETNTTGVFIPAGEWCPPAPQMGACIFYEENFLSGTASRVSGGKNNTASTDYSTISGGLSNISSGLYSTLGGGSSNTALGNYSVTGGGQNNTATGGNAMILGGSDNLAGGYYSWGEGRNMRLASAAARTFAWGYSDTQVGIAAADAFIIAPGTIGGNPWNPKVGIRDLNPAAVLEVNGNNSTNDYIDINQTLSGDVFVIKNNGYIGINKPNPTVAGYAMQFGNANNAYLSAGGVWTNASSREYKENIQPLSSQTAEKSLDELQPVTFNYKIDPRHTNVGFIAEDVPDLVAMNGREKLSAMDIIAVLTKTAQDQEQQIKQQSKKIETIKAEISALKEMLGEK